MATASKRGAHLTCSRLGACSWERTRETLELRFNLQTKALCVDSFSDSPLSCSTNRRRSRACKPSPDHTSVLFRTRGGGSRTSTSTAHATWPRAIACGSTAGVDGMLRTLQAESLSRRARLPLGLLRRTCRLSVPATRAALRSSGEDSDGANLHRLAWSRLSASAQLSASDTAVDPGSDQTGRRARLALTVGIWAARGFLHEIVETVTQDEVLKRSETGHPRKQTVAVHSDQCAPRGPIRRGPFSYRSGRLQEQAKPPRGYRCEDM